MIHYILLPTKERHALRREYRLRLAIITFLFVSIAAVGGMIGLVPSYLFTFNQVNELVFRQDTIIKNREEKSGGQYSNDLLINQVVAQKIIGEIEKVDDALVVQKMLAFRKKEILLNSFQIDHVSGTTTMANVTMQGNATTRDSLLAFKKSLEEEKAFASVELPISNLAKSKNIDFTMNLKVKKI